MSSWTLTSTPPHDWYLCLDVESYFDHEHHPETMFEDGFTRPIPIGDRDVIITAFFNGDVDAPEFNIECKESLTNEEIEEANKSLAKIFGTNLDLRPLYDQAANDPILGDMIWLLEGLNEWTGGNCLEAIQNGLVEMHVTLKPTAKRLM